jgi:hypothetical protein
VSTVHDESAINFGIEGLCTALQRIAELTGSL